MFSPTTRPLSTRRRLVAFLSIIAILGEKTIAQEADQESAPPDSPRLREFRRGALSDVDRIVFAVRPIGQDPHWYANFGYWCSDPNKKMYTRGGRLCVLDLRTGAVSTLVDDPKGGVRDPHVSHDGRTILFSYRKGGEDHYHLWQVDADGTGLRQITQGPYDDIEPVFLPKIVPGQCYSISPAFVETTSGREVFMLLARVFHHCS